MPSHVAEGNDWTGIGDRKTRRSSRQQGAVSSSGDPGISVHRHIGWLKEAGGTQSVSLENFQDGQTNGHPIPVSESCGEGEGGSLDRRTAGHNTKAPPNATALTVETRPAYRNEPTSVPSQSALTYPLSTRNPAMERIIAVVVVVGDSEHDDLDIVLRRFPARPTAAGAALSRRQW